MNQVLAYWVMFLMNPFTSLILAFKNYRFAQSKNIFWGFCAFYGYTFSISKEFSSSDITTYINLLNVFYNRHDFTINDFFLQYLNSGEIDFFNSFLTYALSRFTYEPSILTLTYGIIFGYFYSRNIWIILKELKKGINFEISLVLLALLLIVPIWNINGIRMYLAFHVFMYGLLKFIFYNNRINLFYCLFSVLIHFSYIVPVVILLTYIVFNNSLNLYFVIFVFSMFFIELDLEVLNAFIESYVPRSFVERSQSYRSKEVVESYHELAKQNNRSWYFLWYSKLYRWGLSVISVYFFFYRKVLSKRFTFFKKALSLSLLFFSAANFLSIFPSGSRFYIFSFFLITMLLLLYLDSYKLKFNDIKFRVTTYLFYPIFLLFIIVSIRLGLYSMSVTTLLGNPIISILSVNNNLPINDLIK